MQHPPRIAIVQPVVPDYRVPLFSALHDRYGSDFAVFAAPPAHDWTVRMDPRAEPYVRLMGTRKLWGESIVWQSGHWQDLVDAELVIAPGSLRILSSHWLLLRRRLKKRPTVLWGHAQGAHVWATPFRQEMFRLPDGYIAYTRSNGDAIRRIRHDDKVWVASNSCVRKKECRAALNGAKPPINVVAAGRLVKEKKPVLLVEDFGKAVQEEAVPADAKLIFIGDGPLRRAVSPCASSLGLDGRVLLTGHVSDRGRLESLYADALTAVAPGTLGLFGIQAFSAGVPILVSRQERHGPELGGSRDGFNTVVFDTDSRTSLARAIARFYRVAPPRRSSSRNIRTTR